MKEKIAAVVVTYNRFPLLQKTINALRAQTIKLDAIIVVNNGSTDETEEWLNSQSDIMTIHQDNVGGSGGFYTGIKRAEAAGYDWLWCMDDDVFPDNSCLETALREDREEVGIICPMRLIDGQPFITEIKSWNLSNPFKRRFKKLSITDCLNNDSVEIMGMTFEGPLIKRTVVEQIGLPNKELFILYDDTDYSYRAVLAGYKIRYAHRAKIEKYNFQTDKTRVEIVSANKWKLWYHIRNAAYFYHHYGKNKFIKYFGGYGFLCKMTIAILKNISFNNKYSLQDISKLYIMDKRGRNELLGKM